MEWLCGIFALIDGIDSCIIDVASSITCISWWTKNVTSRLFPFFTRSQIDLLISLFTALAVLMELSNGLPKSVGLLLQAGCTVGLLLKKP